MTHIDYFKLQAKNLFRDYKTQFKDESEGVYVYKPRFFDINDIVVTYNIEEDGEFTLMNAQHIIATMIGFKKWTELIKASPTRLELAKLLFVNRNDIRFEDWEMYEHQNLRDFDDEAKLEVFKKIFLESEPNYKESVFLTTSENEHYATAIKSGDFQKVVQWCKVRLLPYMTRKTINTKRTSYGLKHTCEKEIGFYVNNGTLKAALLTLGVKGKRCPDNSPNYYYPLQERFFPTHKLYTLSGVRARREAFAFKEFIKLLKMEIGDIDFTVEFAGFRDSEPFLDSKNPTEESMWSYEEMLKQWGAESVEVGFSGKALEGYDMLSDNPHPKFELAKKLIGDWLSLEIT